TPLIFMAIASLFVLEVGSGVLVAGRRFAPMLHLRLQLGDAPPHALVGVQVVLPLTLSVLRLDAIALSQLPDPALLGIACPGDDLGERDVSGWVPAGVFVRTW